MRGMNTIQNIFRAGVFTVFIFVLGACQTNQSGPTAAWNGSSEAGVPVKTRLKGRDCGFRFLFIGTSPSENTALDRLYEAAEKSGFKIDGKNYAFQNMYKEESGFLYPLIGYGYLEISADLYEYTYKGTEYSIKDNNSNINYTETIYSLFDKIF